MLLVTDKQLNDGTTIPQLGFGVFQIPPAETEAAVTAALDAGYRHIDTAEAYGNEEGVAAAIARSGIPRDEIYLTTKVFNTHQGRAKTTMAMDQSLSRLQTDHVDLYLIHWPVPDKDLYVETWETLIELKMAGKAKSIGVSNFKEPHLQRIIEQTGVAPAVNQVELHPRLQQPALRRFHDEHDIATEAWSPLAQAAVLDEPTIAGIAERLGRTAAQVVIRWHIELGNIVIPKSVTPERIESNFNVFDFELTNQDHMAIDVLNRDQRIGPDPDHFYLP